MVNSAEVARKIQETYQSLTEKYRHEEGWDPGAPAALLWDRLPQANQQHLVEAVQIVLQDLLPEVRNLAQSAT